MELESQHKISVNKERPKLNYLIDYLFMKPIQY